MVDMTSIVLGELLHGQQHLMTTELAEQAPRLHHGQVSVPALQKAFGHLDNAGIGRYGVDLGIHAGSHQPAGLLELSTGENAAQTIGLGQQTEQLPSLIHHRRGG